MDAHRPNSNPMPMAVLSIAIAPFTADDREKLAAGLEVLTSSDPTIRVRTGLRGDSGQPLFIVAGTSEAHLEAIIDRLAREFRVEARLGRPEIVYETRAGLEPVMLVEITTPEEHLGDVLGDVNRRRGRVQWMRHVHDETQLEAHVPMAELLGYASDLQRLTRHRGTQRMRFDHYQRIGARPDRLDLSEDDRGSFVGAPHKPTLPRNLSGMAVPEPDDDDMIDARWR